MNVNSKWCEADLLDDWMKTQSRKSTEQVDTSRHTPRLRDACLHSKSTTDVFSKEELCDLFHYNFHFQHLKKCIQNHGPQIKPCIFIWSRDLDQQKWHSVCSDQDLTEPVSNWISPSRNGTKICLHEQYLVIHTCFTLILNMAADDDGGSPQLWYRKLHLEQARNRFPSSGPSPLRDTFVGQHSQRWAHLEPPLGLSYAPQIGSLLTTQKSETAGQSV